MKKIATIVLSIAAIQYGFVPPIVDLTESHVFHPDWTAHAKFHMVWLLAVGSLLAAYVLISLWVRPNEQKSKYASIIGCIVLAGFFSSALFQSAYGGSLSDLQEPIQILGIDGNIVAFSIAAILQIIGTAILWYPKRGIENA